MNSNPLRVSTAKMVRQFVLALAGVFMLVFNVACDEGPKTEEQARQAAQGVFAKQCAAFHYDPNFFTGPIRIEVGGADFAYEWKYEAVGSDFAILVGVNRHGVEPTQIGQPPEQ